MAEGGGGGGAPASLLTGCQSSCTLRPSGQIMPLRMVVDMTTGMTMF